MCTLFATNCYVNMENKWFEDVAKSLEIESVRARLCKCVSDVGVHFLSSGKECGERPTFVIIMLSLHSILRSRSWHRFGCTVHFTRYTYVEQGASLHESTSTYIDRLLMIWATCECIHAKIAMPIFFSAGKMTQQHFGARRQNSTKLHEKKIKYLHQSRRQFRYKYRYECFLCS